MKDLKERTIRGGVARLAAQVANFVLRLGSLTVLARLLGPTDFGLIGMVTGFTGVLDLFRDFGLSAAAVQRGSVTDEQISNLFWINLSVGALLGLVSAAMAPVVATFYHEPRLAAVTTVLGAGFLFNAAGIQHSAILQRQMRFTALAVINTASLIAGIAVAVAGALAGLGYWALVAMTVTVPGIATVGCWLAAAWLPKLPRKGTGIRSLVRFGGTLTLNGLVAYLAYNVEKILLGRFWGADALGIYGRAYQLVNIPTGNLNSAAGEVAFSALSRLQDDPCRLRSYFLKGYTLVLTATIPLTIACALFARDVILVLLGPKWESAVSILRLLAPTILVFAVINPLGWLLYSIGLVGRSLKIALVFAPLIIAGYVVGLPHGPEGVAFAYSAVMVVWLIPHIAWCVHGTIVSLRDIFVTAARPLISGIVAGGIALGVREVYGSLVSPLQRLALETSVLLATFSLMLLFVTGEKSLYLDLLRGLAKRTAVDGKSLAAA